MNVRKKGITIGCIALLVVFLMGGSLLEKAYSASEPEMIPGVEMPKFMKIKGMTSKGSPYEFEAMSYLMNIEKMFPGTKMRQIPGGSKEGTIWTNKGEVDMSLGSGLSLYASWYGSKPIGRLVGFTQDMRNARTISSWGPVTQDCMVVLRDSDIYSLKDFWNKNVHAGPPGSAYPMFCLPAALALHGITYESIKKNGGYVIFGKETDALEQLKAGRLHTIWHFAPNPYGPLMEVNMMKGVRLIPYTEEEVAAMVDPIRGDSVWVGNWIPKNTYEGQTEDVRSVGYRASVIVPADMPDDVVYNILWAQWCGGRWKNLQEMHPSFKNIDFLKDATCLAQLPWHPGAVKFWTDWGRTLPPPEVETVDPDALYEAKKILEKKEEKK